MNFNDGRRKAPQLLPRRPAVGIRTAQIRKIIEHFEERGNSGHSGNATTLQYVINYCEAKRAPYRIWANPGVGYYIEKLPEIEKQNKVFEEFEA